MSLPSSQTCVHSYATGEADYANVAQVVPLVNFIISSDDTVWADHSVNLSLARPSMSLTEPGCRIQRGCTPIEIVAWSLGSAAGGVLLVAIGAFIHAHLSRASFHANAHLKAVTGKSN